MKTILGWTLVTSPIWMAMTTVAIFSGPKDALVVLAFVGIALFMAMLAGLGLLLLTDGKVK